MGEMRGGWEGGPRERIYVHLQLIHITVRQKVTQHCQATMHPPNKQTNKRTNSRPFFASDKAVAQKRLPPRTQMWAAHDRGWRQSAVADLGVWWRVGSTSLHLPLFWFSLPLNCTGLASGRRGTGAWAERRALSGWRCLSCSTPCPGGGESLGLGPGISPPPSLVAVGPSVCKPWLPLLWKEGDKMVSLGDSGAVIIQAPGTANARRAPPKATDAAGLCTQGCVLPPAEARSAAPFSLRKIVIRVERWLRLAEWSRSYQFCSFR